MRVLHCIWSMGGGGAERQLAVLASGLSRIGVEVHVALVFGGPNMTRLEQSGAQIHQLEMRGRFDLRVVFRLYRIVQDLKPDIIQTWLAQMDLIGGLVARVARVPWILSERSSRLNYPPKLMYWLRTAFGSWASSAIVSNSTLGDAYWLPVASSKIIRRVIPNSVSVESEGEEPVTNAVRDGHLILFVGRFSREKNLENLVLALADVLPRFDAKAVFCGDGPLRDELRALIARHGLIDRTVLTGFTNDVATWLRQASLLTLVSVYEGDPNVVKEAMAARCPLVLSDIEAHRQIVSGDMAVLVNLQDPVSIAEGFVAVLSDPLAAARRAEAAYQKVHEWAPSTIAARYRAFYAEITNNNAGISRS